MQLHQWLYKAENFLNDNHVPNSKLEAEWLLAAFLGVSRGTLFLEHHQILNEESLSVLQEWLIKRSKRIPFAYIVGKTPFLDCQIHVNPTVLVPRPETELLADKIIEELKNKDLQGKVLWDLCTGSGCLAIAIKKHLPKLHVVGSDLSPAALEVAKENGRLNGVFVEWVQGDLFTPFEGQKAHYIVSNPPYISKSDYESLEEEVLHEPQMALVGGEFGWEIYKKISTEYLRFLHPKGKIWLEIGYDQGDQLMQIFGGGTVENDYSGHQRFFSLETL